MCGISRNFLPTHAEKNVCICEKNIFYKGMCHESEIRRTRYRVLTSWQIKLPM
jgi:hypothetical protein